MFSSNNLLLCRFLLTCFLSTDWTAEGGWGIIERRVWRGLYNGILGVSTSNIVYYMIYEYVLLVDQFVQFPDNHMFDGLPKRM